MDSRSHGQSSGPPISRSHGHSPATPIRPVPVPHQGATSFPARLGVAEPAVTPAAAQLSSQARQPPGVTEAGPSRALRRRKERSQNWKTVETLVLINAKRQEHLQNKQTIDKRDLMTTDVTKWMRIADIVMRAGFSPSIRDGPACKTKWNQLVPEYKRISDYLGRSGQNIRDYWDLSVEERLSEGLPKQFSQEFFVAIHEWYCTRAQINPLHLRDVLSPNDCNFLPDVRFGQVQAQQVSDSDPEDPIRVAANQTPINLSTDDSDLHGAHGESNAGPQNREGLPQTSNASIPRQVPSAPPQVPTHILSSSENTASAAFERQGNTAVKKKRISGHEVIAEATKTTGVVMASHMKDISDASLNVERSKIDVQLKLFQEHMSYQRERDLRLYATALVTHDNARLSILKQQEMVQCLQELTAVLGADLSPPSTGHVYRPMPQEGHNVEAPSAQGFHGNGRAANSMPRVEDNVGNVEGSDRILHSNGDVRTTSPGAHFYDAMNSHGGAL